MMSLLFSVVCGFGLLPNCICTYKCDAGSKRNYKILKSSLTTRPLSLGVIL